MIYIYKDNEEEIPFISNEILSEEDNTLILSANSVEEIYEYFNSYYEMEKDEVDKYIDL